MLRAFVLGLVAAACAVSLNLASPPPASADDSQGRAVPVEGVDADRPAPAREFSYGPILSRDPAIRGQIKRLYREQWEYNETTTARIRELSLASAAEADPDIRFVLDREAAELKKNMEIENVQYGLEIARLNGDEARAADFERALDQLLRPENYRPAPVDPSIAEERARRLGLK